MKLKVNMYLTTPIFYNLCCILVAAPYALEGNEINVTMSLQRGLAIVISFDVSAI